MNSKAGEVVDIIKKKGILRPRDLDAYGIQREYLSRLYDRGLIKKTGGGFILLTMPILANITAWLRPVKKCRRG